MSKTLKVIPLLTNVQLTDGLFGRITAISIRTNSICYEVTWWDGRTKKAETFPAEEFSVTKDISPTRVGFAEPSLSRPPQ